MDAVPLLAHAAPDAVVAYRHGKPIHARRFIADVTRLAATLPITNHVLNDCQDRYHFAVGLAAGIVSNRVSLLPSTATPEVIHQLQHFAPDAVCLTDDPTCDIDLPRVLFSEDSSPESRGWFIPRIPVNQRVAYVFTSGSTGMPVPHAKTWGRLVRGIRIEAERFGFKDEQRRAIVATVPPQHMFGFESTVLLALQSGNALCAERPFYPADIADSLAAVPSPRVLVSTPVHLRTLIASDVDLPAVELIVSATAPLAETLARDVEVRYGAPVLEIFGSTETGQIASRRTTETAAWWLWPDVRVAIRDGRTWVEGGHVEVATPMGDILEVTAEDRFLLRGRVADLVNIAGKRSSLAYLDYQLTSVPGVVDGAFFMREDTETAAIGIARLGAVVVAPGLDAGTLIRQLRERLDPVFLPRPLLFVPEIRRNATGKLPNHELQALVSRGLASAGPATGTMTTVVPLPIAADHPAFAGHFPGNPLVPGVVLLDETLAAIATSFGVAISQCTVESAKFLSAARPRELLQLHFEPAENHRVSFTIRAQDRIVASGTIGIPAIPAQPDVG